MDLLVLRHLISELDERLRGARIDQVYAVPKDHVAFVVGRRGAPRLWFCTEPDQPHLYERLGPHPTPKVPPAFAMAARKLLSGRRVEALEITGGDRVVTLRCAGEAAARVVFEIIPRRSTALLVGPDDEIRAVWHPRRGRPSVGEPYAYPRADRRRTPDQLGDSDWSALRAAPDPETLARGLLRGIAGMSLLTAREIVARHLGGEPLPRAVELEAARAANDATAPRIYAPGPLESLRSLPAARSFFIAPYPMRHIEQRRDDESLHVTELTSMIEAAAVYYPLRAALGAADLARADLESALDIAASRTRRTLDAVSVDAESAGDAEAHRVLGDLLLAHPDAPRDGDHATVPDDYAGGEPLQIRIDPSLSLIDNAQRYYRKARRAERSRERTLERRRGLQDRIQRLERLRGVVAEAGDPAQFGKLARQAGKLGAKTKPLRWSAPEAVIGDTTAPSGPDQEAAGQSAARAPGRRPDEAGAAPEEPRAQGRRVAPGIRAFTAGDGSEIMVGHNAEANERLTHKTAAAHDFWLHAEGPGSHVVIRNPRRDERPSDVALAEAASLAAHFSFARGATKVNVRWTQVRHLRKPRGGPKGQVILRRAETILAEPVDPERLYGPDASDA